MEAGTHLSMVGVGVSSKLKVLIAEVTTDDDQVHRVGMKHNNKVYEAERKNSLYKRLNLLDQFPPWDTLIIFSDFNATTGTDGGGYKLCVSLNSSSSRNYKFLTSGLCLIQKAANCMLWYQRL